MKLNEKAAKQQQETNENETSALPKLKIDNWLNFSITNEVRDSRVMGFYTIFNLFFCFLFFLGYG